MLIKRPKIQRKQSLPSMKLQIKGYENIQQTISFWNYMFITGKFPIRCRDGVSLSYYREAKQMAKDCHQQYLDGKVRITTAKTKRWVTRQKHINWFLKEVGRQGFRQA